ncbi:hypothetical protein D3C80_1465460 [compost metagenome]|nr:hypothetical protein PC358_09805 [Pseudomonas capeferrum]
MPTQTAIRSHNKILITRQVLFDQRIKLAIRLDFSIFFDSLNCRVQLSMITANLYIAATRALSRLHD